MNYFWHFNLPQKALLYCALKFLYHNTSGIKRRKDRYSSYFCNLLFLNVGDVIEWP